MPTFKEAKRADRLAAIQQMASRDAPPHWWNDPELAAALRERAEYEVLLTEERLAEDVQDAAEVGATEQAQWGSTDREDDILYAAGPPKPAPRSNPKAPVKSPKGH